MRNFKNRRKRLIILNYQRRTTQDCLQDISIKEDSKKKNTALT